MKRIFPILFITLVFACSEDVYEPSESFSRIYDSNRADQQFNPIDIIPTTTGFTVLTGQSQDDSDFLGVKIIRLDEEGNYLNETDLSASYVIPVGRMVSIDSVGYFFAMEPVTLNAVLIQTGDSANVNAFPLTGLSYPLAGARTSDDQLLLLSYDLNDQETVLSKVALNGTVGQTAGFSIGPGSDIEQNILNHYIDPERARLPFFCGEWSADQYYFNGVYNYSMSLVFTDLSGAPQGVVQGQGMNGGMTYIQSLQGSDFAVFGYQFNDNFIVPDATLNTSGISSSVDLLETSVSEFFSRTRADITLISVNNTSYIAVAAETKSRQIALYFYETATGALRSIHKIGYINPYELASIRVDADNNLLVLGKTYVGGRFERIFLNKLSSNDLQDIIN